MEMINRSADLRAGWITCTVGALALGCVGSCATQPTHGWELDLAKRIDDFSPTFAQAPPFAQATAVAAATLAVADGTPLRIEPVAAADPHPGDQLLYGVCLDVHGERTIWYLHFEVLAVEQKKWWHSRMMQDFEQRVQPETPAPRRHHVVTNFEDLASESAIARIRVEAFDGAGQSLGAADSEEAVVRLRSGLYAACVAGHRQRDVMGQRVALGLAAPSLQLAPKPYADVQTVAEGIAACDGFFKILEKNPVTKMILFDVIALPSFWSIIKNLGIRTGFSIDFFAALPVTPSAFATAPPDLWSAPLIVEMNDQPALLARMIAGPSGSPNGASAGVHGLVGQHPTDPQRTVRVQLLASKRGSDEPRDPVAR